MPSTNFVHIYLRNWKLLALCTLGGLVLAMLVSLFLPWRYSSTVRLLITQTNATGIDPYTAIKSTERIGQNLAELVYSSSFFNAVMNQGGIDRTYFPTDEIDKRQEWQNTIETSVVPGTGVMQVVAYHKNRDQATAIAVGVAKELVAQAPNFYGYSVRLQVIDDPLPSRFYAKPDLAQNAAFGLIFGFLIGSAWVLARIRQVN